MTASCVEHGIVAVEVLLSLAEPHVTKVLWVVYVVLYVYVDATDCVNELLHTVERDLGVVRYVDTTERAHCLRDAFCPAYRVRRVYLLSLSIDGDHRVPRDGDERDLLADRVYAREHDGVAAVGRLAWSAIRSEQQHVEGLCREV